MSFSYKTVVFGKSCTNGKLSSLGNFGSWPGYKAGETSEAWRVLPFLNINIKQRIVFKVTGVYAGINFNGFPIICWFN